MQIRETIEVAGLICFNARHLLEDSPALSEEALSEYWVSSRCRLDNWGRRLRELAHSPRAGLPPDRQYHLQSLAEEVLLGRMLTRTVAAICVAHDRRHDHEEAGPIARNILAGHCEAVARLRPLMRAWWPKASCQYIDTQVLSSRCERWTDLLLAYVLPLCGTPGCHMPAGHPIEFAFDPVRAQEFSYDAQLHSEPSEGADKMLGVSLRLAFTPNTHSKALPLDAMTTENDDLNRRIAGAVLGLFGPEAYDGHGLLRSTLQARLERTSDDTLGMIEDLFGDASTVRVRPPARWRT